MSEQNKPRPNITPSPDGPYLVKDLEKFANQNGTIETKRTLALCRCGGSANKPFCDGTHAKIGFSSAKLDGRVEDKRENYKSEQIAIHDNRGICAHAGRCTDGLSSVFRLQQEPWIHPDAASPEEIINVIRKCPSGALSFSVDNVEQPDLIPVHDHGEGSRIARLHSCCKLFICRIRDLPISLGRPLWCWHSLSPLHEAYTIEIWKSSLVSMLIQFSTSRNFLRVSLLLRRRYQKVLRPGNGAGLGGTRRFSKESSN